MPWKTEHKERSRDKILASAASLFTQQGYDRVSIDDVMQDADLTRGAFYAHFSSKSELYREAVMKGAAIAKDRVMAYVDDLEGFAEQYLRIGRGDGASAEYCPLAFLVTDIGHQNDEVKSTYARMLKGYQAALEGLNIDHNIAVQSSILLIGGLAMSRAVNDKALADSILKNSLDAVLALSRPN